MHTYDEASDTDDGWLRTNSTTALLNFCLTGSFILRHIIIKAFGFMTLSFFSSSLNLDFWQILCFFYFESAPLMDFSVLLTHGLSYIIEGCVCYLTMCDRAYPKKLAFQYLEDLKNEFERVNGSQIETAARPYAFIKFGTSSYSRFFHVLTIFPIVNFSCIC